MERRRDDLVSRGLGEEGSVCKRENEEEREINPSAEEEEGRRSVHCLVGSRKTRL